MVLFKWEMLQADYKTQRTKNHIAISFTIKLIKMLYTTRYILLINQKTLSPDISKTQSIN
jgi:hypothetical protein